MTSTDIAFVTGARGGVGSALVARLRARGLRVAAVGRDAASLASTDADAHIEADVTTPEGAAAALDGCRTELGDAPAWLAHAVGSTLITPLHRTKADAARDILRVNLESSIWILQAWLEATGKEPGAAVFASSVVARIGVANHEAIAAAKGGVEALVRSAAATYASRGIRVNAVAPGMTDTPMTAGMLSVPMQREGAEKQYPLGGVQSADEVAAVMDWLLSTDAARITGQVVPVDGGFTTIRPFVK
ncbi:SDR family oxidoreductase [Microbacterium sp. NPDC079995]|uniref:SDR family NAD(P)-dependent oxidoreductase n=1 Tax=unclassified Microbacterium TaxID=2609290 RepID=UPI00344F59BA